MLLCSGRLLTRFGVALMIRCYAGYGVHPGGPFNPFNASHYSGGSSGGSAVAVAMGICPVAIGFDGQSVVLHATNTQCHQHTVSRQSNKDKSVAGREVEAREARGG